MTPFTDGFVAFLSELERHNTTDWFAAHRTEYEQAVRAPMRALAEALVAHVRAREPEFEIAPARTLYRIDRNRRKPGAPAYRTDLGITIMRSRRADFGWPGYTVRIGTGGLALGGGLYGPKGDDLTRVRRHVAASSDELRRLLAAPSFREHWGQLEGRRSGDLPPDLRNAGVTEPLVANTQWVYSAERPDPAIAVDPGLVELVIEYIDAGRPINTFLKRGLAGGTRP